MPPRWYATQNGSPLDTAMLAKALLAAPGHTLPVAPGGNATLTEKDRRTLDGTGGKVDVITYELSGLSLTPTYISLDAKGDLFSIESSDFFIGRAGYEKGADAPMRALAEGLASSRLGEIQAKGAHNWTTPVRLRNVRLFDPVAKALTAPRDVVWYRGRISEVVPTGSISTPGEVQIEGNFGTLIPGLTDTHAHLGQEDALMNVLAGVTSVRDMGNNNAVLDKLIERIGKGEVAGPASPARASLRARARLIRQPAFSPRAKPKRSTGFAGMLRMAIGSSRSITRSTPTGCQPWRARHISWACGWPDTSPLSPMPMR